MKFENFKKYSKFIGIILFIYILSRVNLYQLWATLKGVKLSHLLISLFLIAPILFSRLWRWGILVNSLMINVPLNKISEPFLKSLLLGIVTPGKIGEFWRAKYLAEISDVSEGKAFYTALLDKMMDIIVMLTMSIFAIISLFWIYEIEMVEELFFSIAILLVFTIYFLIKKEKIKDMIKYLIKVFIPQSAKEKTNLFLDDFFWGLGKLNLSLFLKAIILGLAYYLVSVLAYYFIALALGINIPFWYLLLIIAPIWFIASLPISISGLGTREAGYIFFFSILGISSTKAVVFSLVVLSYIILMTLPGVILFLKEK